MWNHVVEGAIDMPISAATRSPSYLTAVHQEPQKSEEPRRASARLQYVFFWSCRACCSARANITTPQLGTPAATYSGRTDSHPGPHWTLPDRQWWTRTPQRAQLTMARTAVAFDLYGTLLSTESIARHLARLYGDERAKAIAAQARRYQLEYTWRINSMGESHAGCSHEQ